MTIYILNISKYAYLLQWPHLEGIRLSCQDQAPRLWNILPLDIHTAGSLQSFTFRLKIHFYTIAVNSSSVWVPSCFLCCGACVLVCFCHMILYLFDFMFSFIVFILCYGVLTFQHHLYLQSGWNYPWNPDSTPAAGPTFNVWHLNCAICLCYISVVLSTTRFAALWAFVSPGHVPNSALCG